MSKPLFDPELLCRMHDAPYPALCIRDRLVYDCNTPAKNFFSTIFQDKELPFPIEHLLSKEAAENYALWDEHDHRTGRMKSEWDGKNYHVDFLTQEDQTLMIFTPVRRMDDNHLPQFMLRMDEHIRNQLAPLLVTLERLSFSINRNDEKAVHYLSEARRNACSLLRLSNNLSRSAKCFDGLDYADPEHTDLCKLCRVTTEQTNKAASFSEVRVIFECAEEEVWANVERKKVECILFNLLSNAVCHSKPGDTVRVSLVNRDEGILIQVRDEGEGLENQSEIFEKYRHYHHLAFNDCSTGLGLALSASYVEQHGGTIVMSGTKGKGSTVTVTFPHIPEQDISLCAPGLDYDEPFPHYLIELATLPNTAPLYNTQKDLK